MASPSEGWGGRQRYRYVCGCPSPARSGAGGGIHGFVVYGDLHHRALLRFRSPSRRRPLDHRADRRHSGRRPGCRRATATHHGHQLLRGAEGAGAQLTRQIPWPRVFVEGRGDRPPRRGRRVRGLLTDHRVGAGGGLGCGEPRTAGREGAPAHIDRRVYADRVALSLATLEPVHRQALRGPHFAS